MSASRAEEEEDGEGGSGFAAWGLGKGVGVRDEEEGVEEAGSPRPGLSTSADIVSLTWAGRYSFRNC